MTMEVVRVIAMTGRAAKTHKVQIATVVQVIQIIIAQRGAETRKLVISRRIRAAANRLK